MNGKRRRAQRAAEIAQIRASWENDTIDHEQVRVECGEFAADIDVGIAPLIEAIWRLGIPTLMSCEDLSMHAAPEGFEALVVFECREDFHAFEVALRSAFGEADSEFDYVAGDLPLTPHVVTTFVYFQPADVSYIATLLDRLAYVG